MMPDRLQASISQGVDRQQPATDTRSQVMIVAVNNSSFFRIV